MRLVFIEGNPGAGKDAVGEIICNEAANGPWVLDHLMTEVEERCHGAYKLFTKKGGPAPGGSFREVMDEPTPLFDGRAPRSAYRYFYDWACINFGEGSPGRWLVQRADFFLKLQEKQLPEEHRAKALCVADCLSEIACEPVVERFGDDVTFLSVFRPGCFGPRPLVQRIGKVEAIRIQNTGTLEDLRNAVRTAVPHLFLELP